MRIKVAFVSLGCPKNSIDSEVMLAKLVAAGMEPVENEIYADVVVVNTCAFIQSAKEEAIENILDVAWLRENRSLKGIVAAGCLAQRYRDDILTDLPEVDAVVGVGNLDDIVDAVEFAYEHGGQADVQPFVAVSSPECQALGGDRVVTPPEHSVYIKLSEGCDNHCSYCVIPSIRGPFRSRPMDDLLKEAQELARLGAKELILVSQDTTRYGFDLYGKPSLDRLLTELCNVDGIEWIRMLYCYPEEITAELVETIASQPKVLHYLDIPIQHISDHVLKEMNRRGDGTLIRRVVRMLRERIPDVVLRTTVIVGFPGETKEDFAELCEFLKEVRFERLGAFCYSAEEGTPAAELKEGRVSEKIKEHRRDVVMRNQQAIHEQNNQMQIGKTVEVLCEGYDRPAEIYFGRSYADAPDIDGKVYFTSKKRIDPGTFVQVKVTGAMEYDLIGENVLL